jgi:UDP-N-acetylmuramoyl-tripeptide--D-alanyl-D-alanine ligase
MAQTAPGAPRASLPAPELAALLGAAPPEAPLPAARGATHHSGRVRPGDAFFALPGAATHGIRFADDALAAGAALVVSDRPHPQGLRVADPGAALLRLGRWARARLTRPLLAVTGSAGKTTAKALLAAATGGETPPGNLNTPHALAGALTRAWSDGGSAPLVLELGIDRVGEMDQLTALVRPDVGVLTAIAASHLDGLGDVATVAREKGRLLAATARGLAADGAWRQLPDELALRALRYGLDADAPWRGRLEGPPFDPVLRAEAPVTVAAHLPGPGRGLAESALGALAAAALLGLDPAAAAARLADARLEPGRLQLHRRDGWTLIDDSYNSNPASAEQALALLRAAPPPRTAVLGEMRELGAEAEARHRALGQATLGLERVLAVGPHAEAVRAGNPAARVVAEEEAERAAAALPREGTILVKASRGLRFERLVRALLATEEGA